MKYLWFGLALITVALSFTIINAHFVDKNLMEIKVCLDRAETAIVSGDNQTALLAANEALELWDKRHTYLAAVLRHDAVNHIEELLHLAARGIEDSSDGVKDAIIDAKAEIEGVIHGETLCVANVL